MSNTAATDADFFIGILLKNRRPCCSNRFVAAMFGQSDIARFRLTTLRPGDEIGRLHGSRPAHHRHRERSEAIEADCFLSPQVTADAVVASARRNDSMAGSGA
jgi:hypothetical protein